MYVSLEAKHEFPLSLLRSVALTFPCKTMMASLLEVCQITEAFQVAAMRRFDIMQKHAFCAALRWAWVRANALLRQC